MGGAIGGIGANMTSVLKGLNVSGVMQQSMSQIAAAGDQRAAFNAILLATAASVAKKPNFNLELEINDLWIRLGNLRNTAPSSVGLMGAASPGMIQQLSSVLGNIESAMQNLAKSVK